MSDKKFHFDKHDMIEVEVSHQGGPMIEDMPHSAHIMGFGENACAIAVNMKSKRCGISGVGWDPDGVPTVTLDPEGADNLKVGLENELTEIRFPQFKGWSTWCAQGGKYTTAVCLVRNQEAAAPVPTVAPVGSYVPTEVELAMEMVRKHHPSVCAVAFFPEGRWLYFAADGSTPKFEHKDLMDTTVLEDAMDAAHLAWGLAHVYELEPMGFEVVPEGSVPIEEIAFQVETGLGIEDELILIRRSH